MKNLLYLLLFIGVVITSCKNTDESYKKAVTNPELYNEAFMKVVDIITHDIFAPPVAGRIYAYTSIAGYEAQVQGSPTYNSYAGQLKGLTESPKPQNGKDVSFPIAGVAAALKVGQALVFSEDSIKIFRQKAFDNYTKMGVPSEVLKNSFEYGDSVGAHILRWASKDNYLQTRTMPKYTVKFENQATWKPTPPMLADALEPNWNLIRPLVMDSASQFRPTPPYPFSLDKNSIFYKQAKEVMDTIAHNDSITKAHALYWDDNALAMNVAGHVMFSKKKISPGGHWICIVNYVSKDKKLDIIQSAEAYSLVSIALFEGFLSCWDEKYRSEYIRPETYINQYMDKNWQPFLQTPPFPEYTSGHSVISSAAATVLTKLFGDNCKFTDRTEEYLDFPARTYNSFNEAAKECALSRMYGGIHFRQAIEEGNVQGRNVGENIVNKVKTKK